MKRAIKRMLSAGVIGFFRYVSSHYEKHQLPCEGVFFSTSGRHQQAPKGGGIVPQDGTACPSGLRPRHKVAPNIRFINKEGRGPFRFAPIRGSAPDTPDFHELIKQAVWQGEAASGRRHNPCGQLAAAVWGCGR